MIPTVAWPVLELLFEPGAGDELAVLVRALADHCRPTAPDHTISGSARLLSSPNAPEAYLVTQAPLPYAVVVASADDVAHPIATGATVLVPTTFEAQTAAEAGPPSVPLSRHALMVRELLPVPPSVRSTLRRNHRLADDLVVTVGRPHAKPMSDATLATALRLAAVADVVGTATVQALALGTPVVTDAPTATAIGAVDGVHVVVADSASSARVAAELAAEAVADPTHLAALGRAGRRLVEEHHDAGRTASLLTTALGLPAPGSTPAAPGLRLGRHLADLGTPAGHPIELQLAERLSSLAVAPRTAGSLR